MSVNHVACAFVGPIGPLFLAWKGMTACEEAVIGYAVIREFCDELEVTAAGQGGWGRSGEPGPRSSR